MRPRDYEEHDAPESTEAHWLVLDDGLLHIWLDPDMDDLARWRFIQSACELNGLTPRRRGVIPLPLPPGIKRLGTAAGDHKGAVTAAAGIAAAGIAAAVIVPGTLTDSNTNSVQRSPQAVAPAPPRPHKPANGSPGGSPPPTQPGSPQRPGSAVSATMTVRLGQRPPLHVVPVSVASPARVPVVHAPPPKLPAPPPVRIPPPVTRQPTPLVAVSLPIAGAQVWPSPYLPVRLRLGPERP